MQPKNKISEEIIKRLNILICLFLEQSSTAGRLSMTDKIRKLDDLGVPQPDIARIIGKPLNYVTAVLSQQKFKKKEKNNG